MANNKKQKGKAIKFGAKMRAYFFTGVLVTAPTVITFYFAYVLLNFIDNNITNLIPVKYNPETYLPYNLPGIGILLLVVGLILVGMFAAGFLGKFIMKFWEWILEKMPVISNLYSSLKQILETVLSQKSDAFRKVIMMEYPRKGLWAIGFITADTKGEVGEKLKDECVSVFLPTTPNPTSGFLLFVPKKDVKELDMSVEEGVKLVISGGIVDASNT